MGMPIIPEEILYRYQSNFEWSNSKTGETPGIGVADAAGVGVTAGTGVGVAAGVLVEHPETMTMADSVMIRAIIDQILCFMKVPSYNDSSYTTQ
jgi:hypothetical protein